MKIIINNVKFYYILLDFIKLYYNYIIIYYIIIDLGKMPVGRSSSYNRSRDDKSSKGSYIDRREIERRLRDKGEEMDRMQRERMQQE